MKLGRKAAALVVAAMAVIAAASPARAADVFDVAAGWTEGYESGTGGTWAASATLTTAGAFSLSASVDDPVSGLDESAAIALADVRGETTLALAPGTYTIKAVLRDVSGNGAATGQGNGDAHAGIGLTCELSNCVPIGSTSTGMVTTADGAVDHDEVVITSRYLVRQAHTAQVNFFVTARAVSAYSSPRTQGTGVSYHGGTASVSLSGTVAEITAVAE